VRDLVFLVLVLQICRADGAGDERRANIILRWTRPIWIFAGEVCLQFVQSLTFSKNALTLLSKSIIGMMPLLIKRILFALLPLVLVTTLFGGTWTQLNNPAPGNVALMLLLPDGTVMAAKQPSNGYGKAWFKLTPDIHGSYVNGTWTTLSSMQCSRLWYSSDVLRDGRVFVAGGEYGTGTTNAEVYDPLSNTWTEIPVPAGLITTTNNDGSNNAGFEDSISKILPNGNVLIAPVYPATNGYTVIFNPTSNTFSNGPKLFRGRWQDEASWVKLPDDSILTIDPYGTNSERYIPSLNQWVNDANVPVQIYDSINDEIGAAFLLPNGNAFFLGGTGHTVIYTPSGNTNAGSWAQGPDIPSGLVTADAPAAMMNNGHILCAVSPDYNSLTTYFYSYEYEVGATGQFVQENSPTGGLTDNVGSYEGLMLDLPDGTVLYSHENTDLYVYKPSNPILTAGKPTINSITPNADGSYHLTGTLLNGISEGAAYGDDAQMNSNYPLVRLTNSVGNVYYERTYNWSSTSVMTGNEVTATEFTNSADLPPGTYSLVVVANGFASDPVNFAIQPSLSIYSSGTNVVLSWPTNAVGFKLEFATNLVSPAIWNTNLPLPVVVSGQNVVTNQMSGTQMFFRLSQ